MRHELLFVPERCPVDDRAVYLWAGGNGRATAFHRYVKTTIVPLSAWHEESYLRNSKSGKPPSNRWSVSPAAWYTGGIAVAIAVPVSIHDILMHMLVSPSTHSTCPASSNPENDPSLGLGLTPRLSASNTALRAAGAAEVLHPGLVDGARVRRRVVAGAAVQVTGGGHCLLQG